MSDPRLRRIDHIGVVVADLDAHVAQLEALGLAFIRGDDEDDSRTRHYRSGDSTIELIDVFDDAARAERLPPGDQATIEHIAFEVDDLEDVRATLEARGVTVSWPPYASSAGDMIWTDAATSGGLQYQFFVLRPGQARL
jgi:catechol 2,3-dioxygenase-like lactoylglutathione lyase family enzyme